MNRLELNYGLLFVVLALMGFGMIMVYSSSAVYALETYGDSLFFAKRQSLFLVLGLMALTLGLVLQNLERYLKRQELKDVVLLI